MAFLDVHRVNRDDDLRGPTHTLFSLMVAAPRLKACSGSQERDPCAPVHDALH